MGEPTLSGLKVLDFTRVLAGPHCTKILSDLGADVLKIEPPGLGDLTRYSALGDLGKSRYFYQQNAGKRCISLDLNYPEGQDIAKDLCRKVDIIVENFRPGTLDCFGLGYADILDLNPSVIYVSISGYGQNTTMSYRGAFAPTIHAETGHVSSLQAHHKHSKEQSANCDMLSHADVYTGLEAAVATLAALHHRTRTGEGQHVDVSMAATMLFDNEKAHADLTGDDAGAEPLALGATESPCLEFIDNTQIVISASPVFSPIFSRYCAMMRRGDLLQDPRFVSADTRRTNYSEFLEILQSWVFTFSSFDELEAHVTEAGLAVGFVRTMEEFAVGEWAQEWEPTVEVKQKGGDFKLPKGPWKFSKSDVGSSIIAKRIGEDNKAVLMALGISETQYDSLVERGIVFPK
jgi:CoA:oxalate CoA-transferase